VFDDSKLHHAYNCGKEDRYVLIVDFVRPEGVPKGTVGGGHTSELDELLERIK